MEMYSTVVISVIILSLILSVLMTVAVTFGSKILSLNKLFFDYHRRHYQANRVIYKQPLFNKFLIVYIHDVFLINILDRPISISTTHYYVPIS